MQQAFWLYYDLKKRPIGAGIKRKGNPDEPDSTDDEDMGKVPSGCVVEDAGQSAQAIDDETMVALKYHKDKPRVYEDFIDFVYSVFDPL